MRGDVCFRQTRQISSISAFTLSWLTQGLVILKTGFLLLPYFDFGYIN
jgi:hypothetical protein